MIIFLKCKDLPPYGQSQSASPWCDPAKYKNEKKRQHSIPNQWDVDPLSLSLRRNPVRARCPPARYAFPTKFFTSDYLSFLTSIHSFVEPTSYKEASLDTKWHQAMDEELAALHKTKTWELVPLPEGKRAIGFMVYKRYGIQEITLCVLIISTLRISLSHEKSLKAANEVLVELLEKSSLELLNSLLNSDLVRQELKFEMLNWLFAEECRSNSIQGDPSNRTASADEIFSVSCEAMPGGKALLPGRVALFLSFLMYSPDLEEDVKLAITRKLGWFLDTLTDEDLFSSILVSQIPVLYSSGKTLELVWEPLFSALLHVYLLNRCPTKSLDTKTPQEAWSSHKPSVSHLRVFGSIAYIKVPDARRTKLEDKGEKCILTKASRSTELISEEETREVATEPQIPRDQQTPQRGSSSPQRYDAPLPIERDFSDMMPRGTRSLEDLYENTEQVEEDITLY
ncbi:hypothetical protein EZV62_001086 [Acer yangbiense]|uniref:Uncharacterized protein n=1 Tax=Acer yangbiense TaxID=1000413 RepID=A0A5C7IT38_9ROSI|nr:hypothetical protein EZV62_001086 [Acer yangbiense]